MFSKLVFSFLSRAPETGQRTDHTCRKCEMTMAACSVLQRHMTSGSVIQTVWHCQISYDAAIYLYDTAGCQNDAAGCQSDAAKPHFEGSQDTWLHNFLHVWDWRLSDWPFNRPTDQRNPTKNTTASDRKIVQWPIQFLASVKNFQWCHKTESKIRSDDTIYLFFTILSVSDGPPSLL